MGFYQFEGQSSGSKGCFKLDIGVLKTAFSKSHSDLFKELFKKNIENQDKEIFKTFIAPFKIELFKTRHEKRDQT